MGLDITAYPHFTRRPCTLAEYERNSQSWEQYRDDHDCALLYQDEAFPAQGQGLEPGLYAYDPDLRFDFCAGAYSSYNVWRNALCRFAHGMSANEFWRLHPDARTGPFAELIAFSDCEGYTGPVVSAKLARDFDTYDDQAQDTLNAYDYQKYSLWRQAFHLAAQGGAVRFH